jgi:murein L,D-transpeptidase YcbB/YkuD
MQPVHFEVFRLLGGWKRLCGWTLIALALGQADPHFAFAAAGRLTPLEVLQNFGADGTEIERDELHAIYSALDDGLIWASTPRRRTLIKLLASLQSDGVDARHLGVLASLEAETSAITDILATRAVLRAAHIIATGATTSGTIPGWSLKTPHASVVETFVAAVRQDGLERLLNDLRPSAPAYRALRIAYVHYLSLAAEPWPALETRGEVRLDRGDSRVDEVIRRLILLDDLAEGDASSEALREAIEHFQHRHGLAVDGRAGPVTLTALNVSPAARAVQLAANLEYWRLLPRQWPNRYILVNAASAQLDVIQEGTSTYTSRVIVGDPTHPTPVMSASITAVTFNPTWTVPRSIATKEILPRLRRDPTYLKRSNIEILARSNDPFGLQLNWEMYSQNNFPFQLRQLPGPKNALGVVKFEMANSFDVYLHDTPDKSLFKKATRALSHGCVRVECAHEFAQLLIADPSVWLKSDLSRILAEGRTVTMPLTPPLPVYLVYFTAFPDHDGILNFRPDVYGRDAVARSVLAPLPHNAASVQTSP